MPVSPHETPCVAGTYAQQRSRRRTLRIMKGPKAHGHPKVPVLFTSTQIRCVDQNAYSAVTPSSAVERLGPSNLMPVAGSRNSPDLARK